MSGPVIQVENLTQHYGIRPVLRDINLEISAGELVAVIGPNGMGKTTLLAAIAGVHSPQKGSVTIAGLRRRSRPSSRSVGRPPTCPTRPSCRRR
jgi:ABC-type Mn2+/Zn2+ transport system ATPase subunit